MWITTQELLEFSLEFISYINIIREINLKVIKIKEKIIEKEEDREVRPKEKSLRREGGLWDGGRRGQGN